MTINKLLIVLSFIFFGKPAFADTVNVQTDQTEITKIKIPKENIQQYKNNKDFDYELKESKTNIFVKIINWVKRKIKAALYKILTWLIGAKSAGKVMQYILKSLPYVAVLVFTYLLFRFLIGANLINLKRNKNISLNQVYFSEDEKLIKEENLAQLIQKSIQNKDYRAAIRYYYLNILKNLMNNQLIDWKPEKTNYDYVKEIDETKLKEQFKNLTYIYDFIWYGNHKLSETDFYKLEQDFKQFSI